ncbi:toxin-antitoxin system YwqK family antitoxin [Reichenbachiella versicolor]|uniref:toxin-antitoxin system YwqK family antitoxin n=1 Tax=Reichenbachiella versicolor TaxID=1821036 RepID=UPI000D6EA4BB|nr:toxin-antitoxin system YwqK family antitoxin [Reichenbachiella versicolor]
MKLVIVYIRPICLLTIGLLFSCRPNTSQDISVPEIELTWNENFYLDNGVVYLDSIPYSGYLLSYRNEKLYSKEGYYDGRLHGTTAKYYSDGKLMQVRPYANGEKDGEHLGYYPNGKLKFKYYFEDGLSQGTHYEWYKDGNPKAEMNYIDGRERGRQRVWRPDGKLRSNYITRENGRQYGMLGIKRCTKIDGQSGNIDPYTAKEK